jgi:hypothetical protein
MYDLLEGPLSSSRRLGILGGALTLNVLFMTESTDHPREDQVAEVADRRPVPPFLGECELGHTTESQTERRLSDAIFPESLPPVSSLL